MHSLSSLPPFRQVAALLVFMAGAAKPAQAVQLPPADQILDGWREKIWSKQGGRNGDPSLQSVESGQFGVVR